MMNFVHVCVQLTMIFVHVCVSSGLQLSGHRDDVLWRNRHRTGGQDLHGSRLLPAAPSHGLRQVPGLLPSFLFYFLFLSTKTECDYLNGWIEKRSHAQKSHPKVVNPRDIAGERKKTKNKKKILFLMISFNELSSRYIFLFPTFYSIR